MKRPARAQDDASPRTWLAALGPIGLIVAGWYFLRRHRPYEYGRTWGPFPSYGAALKYGTDLGLDASNPAGWAVEEIATGGPMPWQKVPTGQFQVRVVAGPATRSFL